MAFLLKELFNVDKVFDVAKIEENLIENPRSEHIFHEKGIES